MANIPGRNKLIHHCGQPVSVLRYFFHKFLLALTNRTLAALSLEGVLRVESFMIRVEYHIGSFTTTTAEVGAEARGYYTDS